MVRSMQTALFIFYIPNPVQSMTSKRYQEMSWTMIRYLLKKVRTWPIGRAVLSTGRLIIYQKVFVNILRHKFILLIATHDMMDMYNLGANMGMYFMYKNREQTKVSVQGTYLNEYLISQPLYELTQGYIPLLFWQFVPPVSTIDRIKRDIQKVVDTYEKGVLLENKTVHVNARIGKEELVQELKKGDFGFVTKRKDNVEELWNLSDGINSPCEEVVQNIVEQIGVKQYQTQCKNALYLNMGDLKLVTNNIPGLVFHSF